MKIKMKEKIQMNSDELRKATRDLFIEKSKVKTSEAEISKLQRQIEKRLIIKQQENKLAMVKFNIIALEDEAEVLTQEIESEIALDTQRSNLMTHKSQLEVALNNVNVLKKQVSTGCFINHRTMKPLEKEIANATNIVNIGKKEVK